VVSKIFEQINDHLFIHTYKLNEIQIGMNEMRVNDGEMSMRLNIIIDLNFLV